MQYSIGIATEQSCRYIELTDAKVWISKNSSLCRVLANWVTYIVNSLPRIKNHVLLPAIQHISNTFDKHLKRFSLFLPSIIWLIWPHYNSVIAEKHCVTCRLLVVMLTLWWWLMMVNSTLGATIIMVNLEMEAKIYRRHQWLLVMKLARTWDLSLLLHIIIT